VTLSLDNHTCSRAFVDKKAFLCYILAQRREKVDMLEKTELDRINELAKFKKERGLTEEESAEQAQLRQKYLEDFRCRFRQQLEKIELVDPEDPRLRHEKNC